ncbi:hypothetical protein SSYM_0553, partial [Serratia symbiotica str. Tucson]
MNVLKHCLLSSRS